MPNKLIVLLQPVCDDKSINLFMNKLIKDEKLGVVIFVEQVSPQLQTLHCEGEDKKAWSCIQKKIYVPQIDATFLKKPFSKSNKQYTTTYTTLFENYSKCGICFY